jgi:hypothetical protein
MSGKLIEDNLVRDGFGPIVRPAGALKEVKERNNGLLLSSGDHIAIRTEKPGTTVTSAPDAVVRKAMTAESSSIVYGLTYRSEGNDPAVTVSAGGTLILVGCHFFKDDGAQTAASGSYVYVELNGHVSCIGCYFHGTQAAGDVIVALGAAPSSVAVGCLNATSRSHTAATVTIIGEVAV